MLDGKISAENALSHNLAFSRAFMKKRVSEGKLVLLFLLFNCGLKEH
jgi:hypothetical protein